MQSGKAAGGRPDFMRQALRLARQAAAMGEVPVGAVLVKDGQAVAAAHNLTRGGAGSPPDPTAHAEIRAIRLACAALGSERLNGCDLYVTLEPCAMCAAAISFARIRRLYYGARDAKGGAVEHGAHFFRSAGCFHAPELYPALSERESETLLKEFFAARRKR